MKLPPTLRRAGIVAPLVFFIATGSAGIARAETLPAAPTDSSIPVDWWKGKYFTGEWFGLRDTLADRGITFAGGWTGISFGILDSHDGSQACFVQEIELGGKVDFAKLTGMAALDGLGGFVQGRYRQGENPNDFVQASDNFQPTHIQSGLQWRLLSFGATYTTPELFGIRNFLTFTGGWLQPQLQFIVQPLSMLFVNASFASLKGIGGNIPFSSSFSTWGGVLTVNPTDWLYAKGAIFMADENATANGNHGLGFQGFAPDPSTNGLMAMYESGITPNIGRSALAGKYAFGSYWYGQPNTSYNGSSYPGVYGFYWQADQMLYRPPSASADGNKSVVVHSPRLNPQGLYTFNLLTFSPGYNQPLAFYFHTGLVYRGLIPTRERDQLMAAFSYGNYSYNNLHVLEATGNPNQPTCSAVLEADYRIQINSWAYFQPYLQYIIRPNGTAAIQNATILGFMTGITF